MQPELMLLYSGQTGRDSFLTGGKYLRGGPLLSPSREPRQSGAVQICHPGRGLTNNGAAYCQTHNDTA